MANKAFTRIFQEDKSLQRKDKMQQKIISFANHREEELIQIQV